MDNLSKNIAITMLRQDASQIIREIRKTKETINEILLRIAPTNEYNIPNNPMLYLLNNLIGRKKIYAGESLNGRNRMHSHKNPNCNKTQIIVRAINKHGWENFEKRVLYQFNYLTCQEIKRMNKNEKMQVKQILRSIEKAFIIKYKLRDKAIGYNVTIGGTDSTGIKRSEETKRKISAAKRGIKLGKQSPERAAKSAEHCRKMATSRRGVKLSWEIAAKHRTNLKILTDIQKIAVNQLALTSNEIIKTHLSISDAAKSLNKNGSMGNITLVCQNKRKSANGFRWEYLDPALRPTIFPQSISRKIPINQINIETNEIIKSWESATDAAKNLHKNRGNIISVCQNKRKSAYGFKWSYSDAFEILKITK